VRFVFGKGFKKNYFKGLFVTRAKTCNKLLVENCGNLGVQ